MMAFIIWLKMHGYAEYLWSAYGLVLGTLSIHLWISFRRLRWVRTRLKMHSERM